MQAWKIRRYLQMINFGLDFPALRFGPAFSDPANSVLLSKALLHGHRKPKPGVGWRQLGATFIIKISESQINFNVRKCCSVRNFFTSDIDYDSRTVLRSMSRYDIDKKNVVGWACCFELIL